MVHCTHCRDLFSVDWCVPCTETLSGLMMLSTVRCQIPWHPHNHWPGPCRPRTQLISESPYLRGIAQLRWFNQLDNSIHYGYKELYNEYFRLQHRESILFCLKCNGTCWHDRGIPWIDSSPQRSLGNTENNSHAVFVYMPAYKLTGHWAPSKRAPDDFPTTATITGKRSSSWQHPPRQPWRNLRRPSPWPSAATL